MPCVIVEFRGLGHDAGRLRDGAFMERLQLGCGQVGEGAFFLQSGPGVGVMTPTLLDETDRTTLICHFDR